MIIRTSVGKNSLPALASSTVVTGCPVLRASRSLPQSLHINGGCSAIMSTMDVSRPRTRNMSLSGTSA
ncbi:MAG: hypothetical protein ACRD2X_26315 [Vicinamibacteraceae bacterium]